MTTFTRIATGDALTVLRQIPSESINACMTSPPYWLLRDYETDGQIGLEPTPQDFIDRLVEVFMEVRRTLRDDGSCWVVLGDTYCGSGKGAGYRGSRKENFQFRRKPTEIGGVPKCLAMIPERFALAMLDGGWILRNKIVWHKPNAIPSSAKDRFTVDFEFLYFFTKSTRYYFEPQFVPYKSSTQNRIRQFAANGEQFDVKRHKSYNDQGSMAVLQRLAHKNLSIAGEPAPKIQGANMRSVWTIPVARCVDAHFAVYPEKLVEIPILAGCPEGGTVLDPFTGAGTTAIVCERLGRSFLGIELNPAYVEIAKRRIREARERRGDRG
jgi:DNA modification methylase